MPIFQVERVEATYCIFVGNDILRAIFDRDCKDEDEKTLLSSAASMIQTKTIILLLCKRLWNV